jgi:serine/threonine protein kinase
MELSTQSVAGPRVILDVVAGPYAGTRFEYAGHDTLLVGRGADTNLQLIDDAQLSRHHLILEFNPPRVYLRDLGSSNGTRVNGRMVQESFLKDGDEIACGETRMVVSLPGELETISARQRSLHDASTRSGIRASGPTPPPPDELPAVVPGYDVIRELGRGGMGLVYLARQQAGGREFAIKIMLPESAASEFATKLFLREVSVLSKLDHPNIVRYHEMGSALGQFYFVMEYVPSRELAELLSQLPRGRRVSFACEVIAQALDGLAYAHDAGIVHRDFKPSNLLVEMSGSVPRVKVSDFGLAKSFEDAGLSGMTLSGQVRGTLAFMAPEQLTHCRDARPPADIYAAGASLYALLSGRPPLAARSGRDIIRVVLEDEPRRLDQVCPELPAELVKVVHKALEKNPAKRFKDAAAMRRALEPFLSA